MPPDMQAINWDFTHAIHIKHAAVFRPVLWAKKIPVRSSSGDQIPMASITTRHLQVKDIGMIRTLVVGDFNADFGQGLTL